MKNNISNFLVILFLGIISNSFSATITENFDSFSGSGYANHVYNGWNIIDGLAESSSKAYLGSGKAVRLDDDNNAALQSPSKLGGVGTVSFWYRTWDGSPTITKIYIEISDDSLSWTKVDSLTSLTNTAYINYSKIINSPTAKFVKVVSSGEERFILDEFSITDAGGCSGFYIDSNSTTICSFDSVSFRGTFYNTTGIYKDTVLSTCDTIFILNLMTTTFTSYNSYDTICSVDDSLLFNGSYLKTSGIYFDTISRTGDCDSIVSLNLYVKYCPIACTEIFISEYIEGSSNNKALEFYNPSSSIIDLSQYEIIIYRSSTDTIPLSGLVSPYDVHVLTHPSAALSNITSNSDATGPIYFNGDDRIELVKGGVVIDRFGSVGVSGNFAKDMTFHRINTVQNGNSVFNILEWVSLPQNTDSLIGSHVSDCFSCTPTNDTLKDTICQGASVLFGTQTLSMTGRYIDSSQNSLGCDSITVMELLVNDYIRDTIYDTICQGASVLFGTQTLSMSGNYSDTSQTAMGCDSITVLDLLVNDYFRDTMSDTICQGASVSFGTQTLTKSGNYSDTSQTAMGCDSITVMELLVNDYIRDTLLDTICQGASIMFGTQTLTMSGNYSDTSQNSLGCDSITVMNLLVNNAPRDTIVNSICSGDTLIFASNSYTVAGFYSDTTQLPSGCDSITTLDLRVILIIRTDNIKLCPGIPYTVDTNVYTTAGTYTDVFTSASGCDSTVITNLSYYPNSIGNRGYLFCKGDSVSVLGNWYFTDSIVRDTITAGAANGCDSITVHTITTKTVSPALNLGPDVVLCVTSGITMFASNAYDTYNWSNGGTTNTITVSGATSGVGSTDYILNVTQASSGCSATDTVNITFLSCVGLEENEVDMNVNLYPNPATNYVTIDIFDKYNSGNLKMDIINPLGQTVIEKIISEKSEKVIIDVTNFNKGLYFIRISSERVHITKKLLIQR